MKCVQAAWRIGVSSFSLMAPALLVFSAAHTDEAVFKVDVARVALEVAVQDRTGRPVHGLNRASFRVWEEGQERDLDGWAQQDAPVTLGLVVDASQSMRSRHGQLLEAAMTLVQHTNPSDEVFVIHVNDEPRWGLPADVPFTANRDLLRQGLANVRCQGRTALYDTLLAALRHAGQGRHGRKALVAISDGIDNNSDATIEDVVRAAQASNVVVHAVALTAGGRHRAGILRRLGALTGGEVLESEHDWADASRRLAERLRARYILTFVPRSDLPHNGPRRLRVAVRGPGLHGLRVLHRAQYWPSAESSGGDSQ